MYFKNTNLLPDQSLGADMPTFLAMFDAISLPHFYEFEAPPPPLKHTS